MVKKQIVYSRRKAGKKSISSRRTTRQLSQPVWVTVSDLLEERALKAAIEGDKEYDSKTKPSSGNQPNKPFAQTRVITGKRYR